MDYEPSGCVPDKRGPMLACELDPSQLEAVVW